MFQLFKNQKYNLVTNIIYSNLVHFLNMFDNNFRKKDIVNINTNIYYKFIKVIGYI